MAESKQTKTIKTPKKEVETKVKEAVKKESHTKKSSLEISVYNLDGKESKTVSLPKELFSVEASPNLLAQYVHVYRANQRQGTASTKSRGEVVGSTRKIYRQKGTGKARHGSKKAPIFVGGGIVGGPQPTDHSLKLNKKQKQKALLYSLSLKAKEGSILGLDDAALKMKPKTKSIVDLMKSIGINETKTIFVIGKMEKNGLVLSIRNLPNVCTISAHSINAYEVLNHKKIVFTEESLQTLKDHYKKS